MENVFYFALKALSILQIFTFFKNSRPEVFLGKCVLKICGKFIGEQLCRSVISVKLRSNFTEIPLRHRCYPVNLLHILRTAFPKNTSGVLIVIFALTFWLCGTTA